MGKNTSARFVGLAVGVALAWASVAGAQTYADGKKSGSMMGTAWGWFDTDTTYHVPRVAYPLPSTDVQNPASVNTNTYYANILDTGTAQGIVPGNAMVSAAKWTYGWRRMAVQLYVGTLNTDTCAVAHYAIMVRGGYLASSDSLSSSPWIVSASTTYDSIGTMSGYIAGVAADNAGLSTSTSTLYPGERLITVQLADGKRSQWIELQRLGEWFCSPYTTVRIRPLDVIRGTNLATSVTSVATTFRADLVRVE